MMGAIRVRVAADLRAHRRATIALALLIGLGGGFVMTASAGARRTHSAYPRFLNAHRGADMLAAINVGGESFFDGERLTVQDFAAMPGVDAVQLLRFFVIRNPLVPLEDEDAFVAVDARSAQHAGEPIDIYKLLEVEIARLAGGGLVPGDNVHIWDDLPPNDIVNFGRVQQMPQFLGLLLGAFAAATLTHTLVTAVTRRRLDLAILKTLGFVRGQVRRAVLVQSLLLTGLALVLGVPTGAAAGRVVWRLFASDLGVVPRPVLDGPALAVGIATALVLAASISILPARAAARTQPALVLRSE